MLNSNEGSFRQLFSRYGGGEDMPVGGYAMILGVYLAAFGGAFAVLKDRYPERFSHQDLLVTWLATHKISRLVTLGKVTSPLRAPLTTHKKSIGSGEVVDTSKGSGLKRGMGHLLTCPFCFDSWAAATFAIGWGCAPRFTRMVAMTFSATAVSDFLHQAYILLKKKAQD